MKPEFTKYLESISLSNVMHDAVVKQYETLKTITGIEFDDIHFADKISSTGNREYFSLWAFTPEIICKISVGQNADIDRKIIIFKSGVNLARFTVSNYNYDLKNPIETSYLDCIFRTFDMDVPFNISATGINCSNLIRLLQKYIVISFKN